MSKYCYERTIQNHFSKQYPSCVKTIDEIIKRESFHQETKEYRCEDYKNISCEEAKAIDLDCVSKKQTPNLPSVDMTFILENENFLAVELKLNAKKVPPIKSPDLQNKETGTKDILNSTVEDFILILCDIKKMKSYLNKIKKGNPPQTGYKMMFLKDFKKDYF